MSKAVVLMVAASALCATSSASAASNRAWVSGHGVDQAGCGAPTAPCRSLQYAHDHIVAAGGEIDILDPAGYGAITITKAISIVNDGVGTAGVQATSGDAITINAGATDVVYLRGLSVDGVGGQGNNGVQFNSGRQLTVDNCVVRHFAHEGISMEPTNATSSFVILNTRASEDGDVGVLFFAESGETKVTVVLEHVITDDDLFGVAITADTGTESVSVSAYDVSGFSNIINGMTSEATASATLTVDVDSSYFAQNGDSGYRNVDNPTSHLSRSVFNQNGQFGVANDSTGGTILSTGDNRLDGNLTGALSSGSMIADTVE